MLLVKGRTYVKKLAQQKIYDYFGIFIFRNLPRGVDPYHDLCRSISTFRPEILFDVGANVGQTAETMSRRFPSATVYSFEPVKESFEALCARLGHNSKILCYQLAFGSVQGTLEMFVDGTSQMNSVLLRSPNDLPEAPNTQTVHVNTIDSFCEEAGVTRIDFLKIDCEGFDLEVLKGAERMLKSHKVKAIQVEVGMNAGNNYHVPFESIKSHLEAFGYMLFGIYMQVPEWPTKQPFLRRADMVFVTNEH